MASGAYLQVKGLGQIEEQPAMLGFMRYTDYSGPGDGIVQAAKVRLRADLAAPGLAELVTAYFDPAGPFAGRSFDQIGNNPANRITCDDLLAVSLLDIRWDPRAVRELLEGNTARVTSYLARIGTGTALWEATDGELRAADELWPVLCGLPGVQDAVASKLLARKRPQMTPITDSVIVTAVGTLGKTWPTLRRCFQDSEFRDSIEKLRLCPEADDVSLLRIFDVALWMRYSNSTEARKARKAVGV
jgi:hypothetical protein